MSGFSLRDVKFFGAESYFFVRWLKCNSPWSEMVSFDLYKERDASIIIQRARGNAE